MSFQDDDIEDLERKVFLLEKENQELKAKVAILQKENNDLQKGSLPTEGTKTVKVEENDFKGHFFSLKVQTHNYDK